MNLKYFDINKYIVGNKIGQGTHFDIYKIYEKTDHIILAAKIFKNEIINSDDQIKLLDMANLNMNISHPSIIKCYGYSPNFLKKENYPAIIYEYIVNSTLHNIINLYREGLNHPNWNFTKVLIIIYGIASAMQFLHSNNILHLELTTSNILIDDNLRPKVGINYFTAQTKEEIPKYMVGTPIFMAPEIKDLKYTKAVDVYAFGMILFELLSEEHKFPFFDAKECIDNVYKGYRPSINSSVPRAYKELIESCWDQDPSKRPTFDEIVKQLETNHDFITDEVDEDEFNDYVDSITSFPILFIQKDIFRDEKMKILASKEKDQKKVTTSNKTDKLEDISTLKQENEELKKQLREIDDAFNLQMTNNQAKSDNFFIDESAEKKMYEFIGRIGEGATSVAYKLIDKKTRKPLCKKVLKYNNGQTTIKDAQNALKEFQVLYQINHPCICKSFYINTSEKIEIASKNKAEKVTTISLFLEFFDYSLNEFLSSNFCSSTMKAKIIVEISHAMDFIHKKGMIHRDLKIENIMLNSALEAKLVDFGLVKISECVLKDYSFFNESMTKGVGTLAYMSPEMLNEENYDNKTDVYSFGIVLYYILIGSLPKQSMKDKTARKPIYLPSESETISKFGLNLIKKCLEPDPSKRPSFEEILDDMRMNSFQVVHDVDSAIICQRDKQLDLIDKNQLFRI